MDHECVNSFKTYHDSALWPTAPNLPRGTRNELGHPAIYYETGDPDNVPELHRFRLCLRYKSPVITRPYLPGNYYPSLLRLLLLDSVITPRVNGAQRKVDKSGAVVACFRR